MRSWGRARLRRGCGAAGARGQTRENTHGPSHAAWPFLSNSLLLFRPGRPSLHTVASLTHHLNTNNNQPTTFHSQPPTLQPNPTNSAGANPQRRGLPKRAPSLTKLVDDLVDELGGDRSINSVLVANNGLAAVKFMRSVRSWANQTFGNSRAIGLVAMATPEDIRINAEHVTLADQFVEVPGGTNNNNYANVKLIVQVAERAGVDAVWPGW